MQWSTACPDWQARILARQSLIPCAPLFPAEADEALGVFDDLLMVDAPGSPRMGDAARPWVREFVASMFGAYDPEQGRRLITEFLLSVSKKNGKSTIAAGIMLTALIRNWRESGEFSIIAPTVEVADNSFRPARDMVRRDPILSDLMHVQEHIRTITHRTTGATLKVVAADSDTVGGKKSIGVLIDELWLFGKRPGAEDMLREATGGLASRPEGFVIYLTTQSNEPPAGVFRQKLQYARGVRDGRVVDPQFLPVLYEFPQSMIDAGEHRKPENFYVTNPNLGSSVDETFLRREFAKSEESGEESVRGFLAKHLNVEIGLALLSNRWTGADYWQKQGRPGGLTLESLLDRCDVAVVGIDGGGLDDLLGLAVVGRDAETGDWLHWARAWAHPKSLARNKAEAPRLQDFARAGDLVIVERIGEDVAQVTDLVMKIHDSGLLPEKAGIGVDPHGIGGILDSLEEAGIPQDVVTGISQGWKLTGAIKTTERKLAEGSLWHSGSGLMAWSVSNARVEPRGNAVVITKQGSGAAKIDPLMATFNAVSLLSLNPTGKRSYYSSGGQLLVF